MAKRKIPGLGKSKGMSNDFPVFPAGKYVFEVVGYTEKESESGTSTLHNFRFKCLDALDDKAPNQEMIERNYFHTMIEMHDDHPSYEQWGHLFVDELKSFVDATGIEVKADAVDFESFEGKTFIATVRQTDDKDAEGNPVKRNRINKYEADSE